MYDINKKDVNKKWVLLFVGVYLFLLLGIGTMTAVIDACFHYHKPFPGIQYLINDERYQNNGIVKHFDYDAIITGTSLTENFKTSELDKLFGVNAVKVPFSGASFKEINDNLLIAVQYNSDIKMIVRCLDYSVLSAPADAMRYEEEKYPRYLYDDILYNDVSYLFNKDILLKETWNAIASTFRGETTTDFDAYANWQDKCVFGKEAVDAAYVRHEKYSETVSFTEEDYQNTTENITKNVIDLVKEHPEIEFYLFFSPYSIYYWDYLNQNGRLEWQFGMEEYAIELLLEYDNIHLFSFETEYEMICNLDNYKDPHHYSEDINSQILIWMKEGKHELAKENYKEYCSCIRDFYTNYDYDSLFE